MRVPLDIIVRSTELDAYGHVNNAKYLEYCEWGRFEWIRATGVRLDAMGPGLGFALVNANVNFRQEAKLDEALRVHTRLVKLGSSSFTFATEIVGIEDGQVRADALVTGVLFDMKQRRSAPIPEASRGLLESLVQP